MPARAPTRSPASGDRACKLQVNVAMLRYVGTNEDGLAAVVAHALAHAQAGHTNADYSRAQEMEADRLGTRALVNAGYDAQRALEFWNQFSSRRFVWWVQAHPPYAGREAELASITNELRPLAATARARGALPDPGAVASADAKSVGLLSFKLVTGEGGIDKDYSKARVYAEHAAEAGDPLGQAVLGALMRDGINGVQNPQRGIALLEKSAQAGTAWANYQLGLTYERGLGVKADREKALQYYRAAAAEVPEAAAKVNALAK